MFWMLGFFMFELYDFKTCEFRFNGFQKFRENEKKRLNNRRDLIFRLLRTKWRIYSVIWARKWETCTGFRFRFWSSWKMRLRFRKTSEFWQFQQLSKVQTVVTRMILTRRDNTVDIKQFLCAKASLLLPLHLVGRCVRGSVAWSGFHRC